MSEDRVSLSEDRHLLGVKNAAGDVIRAKSPNLKKAMGKLGIMKEDLVPPLRETFAEECKRDGVSIPDVIQKRWEVMEQRRLNEIDEVVQKARLSFTQAHRKITFCFLRSSVWASAALAQAPDTRPVNSLRVRLPRETEIKRRGRGFGRAAGHSCRSRRPEPSAAPARAAGDLRQGQRPYSVRLEGRERPAALRPGNCLALVPGGAVA
jgi:hypothetical protein